jgi:hypothetical protein
MGRSLERRGEHLSACGWLRMCEAQTTCGHHEAKAITLNPRRAVESEFDAMQTRNRTGDP